MRDNRSLFLLIFALVVISISFILLSIWGYHFYFQNNETKNVSTAQEKSRLLTQRTEAADTLQNLIDSIAQQLRIQQNDGSGDSINSTLEAKLMEYNRLKAEIAEILKKKNTVDVSGDKEKIGELEQSVDKLRNQNNEVIKQNAQLNKVLQKLLADNKQKDRSPVIKNNITKNSAPPNPGGLPLLVSHLRFAAVTNGDDLQSTDLASAAKKLTGSFQINIYSEKNNSPQIYVRIIQPNGKLLMNSAWESGTFETTDGRKVYSALLHFDNKDNTSRLSFSIDSDKFQKGVYVMEIYHNEIMIGRLTKRLS